MLAPRAIRRSLARQTRLHLTSRSTLLPQCRLLSQTVPRNDNKTPLNPDEVRRRLANAHRTAPKDQDELRGELEENLKHARPLMSNRWATRFTNTGRSWNQKRFVLICVAAAVVFYIANSQTLPVTGRRRFNFYSDTFIDRIGQRTAQEVVAETQENGKRILSESDRRFQRVKEVMLRLVPVSGMAEVDWNIRVIEDDKQINAFVTPGGHLFVFTGMLRVARNDDMLATVLSHEIAHNVASHAAERMSTATMVNLTSGSIFFLAGALPGLVLFGLWTISGGKMLQNMLFDLPNSRKMEAEADHIGLMMMAEACYDPRRAVAYWQEMAKLVGDRETAIPETLMTHPTTNSRVEKMRQWLPEAMEKREQSDCMGGTGAWAGQFKETMRRRQLIKIDTDWI